jgi:2-keto-3-deoxy-L-rhamnonate aldolase RhmA
VAVHGRPYLAEAAATTGYDWLLIDGEHAPNDLRSTLAACRPWPRTRPSRWCESWKAARP